MERHRQDGNSKMGALTAELPANKLMVVGGEMESCVLCPFSEIVCATDLNMIPANR